MENKDITSLEKKAHILLAGEDHAYVFLWSYVDCLQ